MGVSGALQTSNWLKLAILAAASIMASLYSLPWIEYSGRLEVVSGQSGGNDFLVILAGVICGLLIVAAVSGMRLFYLGIVAAGVVAFLLSTDDLRAEWTGWGHEGSSDVFYEVGGEPRPYVAVAVVLSIIVTLSGALLALLPPTGSQPTIENGEHTWA